MRQYVVNFEAVPDSDDLSFTVLRHKEAIGEFTAPLMSGLERVRDVIAEDYSCDPL